MTRRVFLHVGLPKTGTTYLQDTLWANRGRLAERGLLLPGRRRTHLLASLEVREDPGLAHRPGNVRHPWRDLVEEARQWPQDVLISHEFFGAATADQARRAVGQLAEAEVHVIVTARAMVDLFLSRWQEWIKNGARGPIDDYPPEPGEGRRRHGEWGWPSFDLGIVLGTWGTAVPHERVHVLPMAPGRSDPRELWQRLLAVLGVAEVGLQAPSSAANPSLGLVEVELLRRVNRHLVDFRSAFDRGRWIRGYLGESGVLPSSGERFRPGDEKLHELLQRGRTARALLDDGTFDVVGDPGLLDPIDVTDRRHPSEVTDTEMLTAATCALARMTSDVRSLTRQSERTVSGPPRRRRWHVSVLRLLAVWGNRKGRSRS